MDIKLQTNISTLTYLKRKKTLVLFIRQSGHNELHMKWKLPWKPELTSLPRPEGRAGPESRGGSLRVDPIQHSTKACETDQIHP